MLSQPEKELKSCLWLNTSSLLPVMKSYFRPQFLPSFVPQGFFKHTKCSHFNCSVIDTFWKSSSPVPSSSWSLTTFGFSFISYVCISWMSPGGRKWDFKSFIRMYNDSLDTQEKFTKHQYTLSSAPSFWDIAANTWWGPALPREHS